jgi:hypothetical protein
MIAPASHAGFEAHSGLRMPVSLYDFRGILRKGAREGLLGGVAPQIGIVNVFLGDETWLGLARVSKRFAFKVGDDFVQNGNAHGVWIRPTRGHQSPSISPAHPLAHHGVTFYLNVFRQIIHSLFAEAREVGLLIVLVPMLARLPILIK